MAGFVRFASFTLLLLGVGAWAQDTGDQELDQAFNPPTAPAPTAEAPPAQAPSWTGPADVGQASAELRAQFTRAMADLRQAAGAASDRDRAARTALGLAARLEPQDEQAVWELMARAASERRDARGLERAADGWRNACGPQQEEACRRAAVALLRSAPLTGRAAGRLRSRAKALEGADLCLWAAQRAARRGAGRMPGCLSRATNLFRRAHDRPAQARAMFLKVSANSRASPKVRAAALAAVAKTCPGPQCRELRAEILHQALPLLEGLGDTEGAARLALEELKLLTARLPPEARLYARTPEVDRACERLEAERNDPAACHRLEKPILGRYSVKDFSKEKVDGEGLPAAVVRKVGAHYSILVEDCVAEHARARQLTESDRYLVHWTVLNDGHVDGVHLDRDYLDADAFGTCVHKALAVWRYPRFAGERQNVDQTFTLNARHTWSMSN